MKLTISNTTSQILPDTADDLKTIVMLKRSFTTLAPGAEFSKAYQLYKKTKGLKGWDGKAKAIDVSNTFPTGLSERLSEMLHENKIKFNVEDKRIIVPIAQFNKTTVTLRDYQANAVNTLLKNTHPVLGWNPRGILKIATGGGKTEIAVAIYQMLKLPTMFLVHRRDLLNQTIERFSKFGVTAAQYGAGSYNLSSGITVSTIQTIISRIKKNDQALVDHLKNIKVAFFDEAHLMAASLDKGNTFVAISRMMPNAFARIGLTATPLMKDKYSDWLLEGETGPVRVNISNKELIDTGYLTAPEIKVVDVPRSMIRIRGDWQTQYDMGIVNYSARNKLVVEQIQLAVKPALVMTARIEHAENILNMLGGHAILLKGDTPVKERTQTIKELQEGRVDTVICTTIFDEGIDITNLRTLVLAGGGKSNIKSLQRIGRGLRLHPGKHKVTVIDFVDNQSMMLFKHSLARLNTWKKEGFTIVSI